MELGPSSEYGKADGDRWLQILFNGRNHWLLVANNFVKKGVVLYDSLPHARQPIVEANIACLLRTSEDSFDVAVAPCQYQINSDDCGVMAIAFATELLFGGDPSTACFIQSQLRKHLKMCLRNKALTPFPKGGHVRKVNIAASTITVQVHCTCRRPQRFLTIPVAAQEDMAACSKCSKWFHRGCQSIPNNVFLRAKAIWTCTDCLTRV